MQAEKLVCSFFVGYMILKVRLSHINHMIIPILFSNAIFLSLLFDDTCTTCVCACKLECVESFFKWLSVWPWKQHSSLLRCQQESPRFCHLFYNVINYKYILMQLNTIENGKKPYENCDDLTSIPILSFQKSIG